MLSATADLNVAILFGVADFTGASKMGYYFALAFQRAGLAVSAVSPPKPAQDFGGADSYASVIDALADHGIRTETIDGLDRLASVSALRALTSWVHRSGVTHLVSIHQNSLKYAAAAARLARVRHVSSRQGPVLMYGNRVTRRLKALVFKQCLQRGTDLSVCTNALDQRQLIEEYGCRASSVHLLPNGIDLAAFPPPIAGERERLRHQLGIQPDELMLINVGRLDPQKDQLTLLRAFLEARPLPQDAKLVLVGNVTAIGTGQAQRYADSLHAFVRDHDLANRVVFAGWRNDVAALLHAADVYVHSAAWEGFPLAMCEAMAARLPFVGTDCFGIPDGFVQGQHGRLVPKGNPQALAGAMRETIALSPSDRRRLGENGRRLVEERYDARRIADRFVQLTLSVSR